MKSSIAASANEVNSGSVVRTLVLHWPWWLHPAWALLMLVGSTAAVAIAVPQQEYNFWGVNKFLDTNSSLALTAGIILMLIGILLANYRNARGGHASIRFTAHSIKYLNSAYRWLLTLTILGYFFWVTLAVFQGVRPDDLLAVLDRQEGAIRALKESSRPVGGLTTLTQFGPVAIVVGYILRRLRAGGRTYWVVIVLAAGRAVFYAERLALLEVLFALVLVASVTTRAHGWGRGLVQVVPFVLGPVVWLVFALSEYSRSWVYYERIVSMPFDQWVTSRLLGYYTTSYNNSALYLEAHNVVNASPYVSVQAFWDAPGVEAVFGAPDYRGSHPSDWWTDVLRLYGNPEFNNTGSFLVTYAELGWLFFALFWLIAGWAIGSVFASITQGSFPALVAYCVLFIGLLELPRFIYWSQGRSTPIIVALVVLWWTYPKIQAQSLKRGTASPSRARYK